jgi:hypothetical protein
METGMRLSIPTALSVRDEPSRQSSAPLEAVVVEGVWCNVEQLGLLYGPMFRHFYAHLFLLWLVVNARTPRPRQQSKVGKVKRPKAIVIIVFSSQEVYPFYWCPQRFLFR